MRLPTRDEAGLGVGLAVFALTAGGLVGALIYSMVRKWRQFTLPRHLKTFAQMQPAFVAGSKADQFDRRRGSAWSREQGCCGLEKCSYEVTQDSKSDGRTAR